MPRNTTRNAKYFTHGHNVDACLANGSFVREYPNGERVQYMNGDYMGVVNAVPKGMVEVPAATALELIPKCCK
jgi:hypothetical protein